MLKNLTIFSALSVILACSACGGGGGGGSDFLGAARADISASPHAIDTGDRTLVEIQLSEIHENGISVKISYPEGLRYVEHSAFLRVRSIDIDVGPTENVAVDGAVYLVFYLTQAIFGDDQQGTLRLELEGSGEITDGIIGVDPDVDDPEISNSEEFDSAAPEYVAEDEASIDVVG